MARRRRRRSTGRRTGVASFWIAGPCPAAVERLESRRPLAILFWDPDAIAANNVVATGAGLGGSGMWTEGGAAVWFDPMLGNGAGGHVRWDSSRGDTAVLTGLVGSTVTVAGNVGAVAVEFRGSGCVVSGGGFTTPVAGTTFTTVVDTRFDTPIDGPGGVVKAGAATLSLGAPLQTYSGETRVTAGLLDVRGTIHSHVRPSGGRVQGVMFHDPDVAGAVREALALDSDTRLTPEILAQSPPLTALVVDGNVVGDLTGIANLASLETLEFVPGDHAAVPQGLTSLAPLAGLPRLSSLTLVHVGLTDEALATLPSLPGLVRLDVRSNLLSAVPAAVAELPKLAALRVHGNPVLTDGPRVGLASLRGRAIDVDVAPDRPEMATGIADLAARLYHLPLEMLEFVSNTIAFQPYAGAMKGPLATLQTRAGNDWDTSALLAALYAAAGIPTRYVAGAIEVTEKQLADFVGTRDPRAAASVLAAIGLKHDQYGNHLKHAWLEAFVTVPTSGRQEWVPIDASWKVRDFRPGLPGVLAAVPFSPQESELLTNPAWRTRSPAEYYADKVAAWLTRNRPDLTIADVGYDGPIRQQAFATLPSELPYTVLSQPVESARTSAIPDSAHYRVNVRLANGPTQLFGAAGVDLTLAEVALSRLTIDPSPDGRPTLRRDGVAVVRSAAVVPNPAATQVSLTISITSPGGGSTTSRTFMRPADRFIAIGLDANQFSEALLVEKRATATAQQLNLANGLAVDQDQAVGGLLDLAIASFFTAADADEAAIAALTSAIPDRSSVALGIATGGPVLVRQPNTSLQFPALPAGMGIDVPANVGAGFPIESSTRDLDVVRDLLIGCANSAHEALVLEELTNFESVSTMRAFQVAVSSGGAGNLVEINAGNVSRIAALLPQQRPEIRAAIASAVKGGVPGYLGSTFTAVVTRTEVSIGSGSTDKQWRGVGYTLTLAADGRTVGYIIQGSVGSGPILSYGGATSWVAVAPPVIRASAAAGSPTNYLGDPVNVATGNVYHEETDVEIANLGGPLAFRRRYDSVHTVSGLPGAQPAWSDRGLGEGWSFTYCDRLEVAANGNVTWFTDTGLRHEFRPWRSPAPQPAMGGYLPPEGLFGGLSGSAKTGFTWTDWDGNRTSFGPAVAGVCPLVGMQDRFGNGVRVTYVAGTNRLARVTDLRNAGRWLSFSYNNDAQPRLSAVADFTGRSWTYTYAAGRLVTTTAPAPGPGSGAPTVGYAYHADAARRGLLASVTDPGGGVTAWDYYANRRGFRVTDAEGIRHSFAFNLHRRQSIFVNERGVVARYAYDDRGNLLETRQADRTAERSTWSAAGQKLSTTDALGATTTFAYDPSTGKLTRATDPLGNVTTWTYTNGPIRDPAAITRLNRPNDASDDVATTFTYDASGFLLNRVDDAGPGRLNLTTRWTPGVDGRGLTATMTTPQGWKTTFTYDAAGLEIARATDTGVGGVVTQSCGYDQRGNLVTSTDGNGSVTTTTFDALGRKTTETLPDPDGAGPLPAPTTAFAYDISGNLLTTVSHDGRRTWMTYDRRQRETARTGADGTSTRVSYDPVGNKATETDALGRVTRFAYDSRDRLVATLLPDGTSIRSRYDGVGRSVAMIDQSGATTFTTYDVLGRKIRETLPDGGTTAWGYDSRGNVQFVTPAFVGEAGVAPGDPSWSTHSEYDALGRRTKETRPDPDGTGPGQRPVTTWAYDRDGNPVSTTDPRGFVTSSTYDAWGRKVSEISPDPDGAGPLVPLVKRFVYDRAGNLRFEVAPGGSGETDVAFTTEHVYDGMGREISTVLPDPDGAGGAGRPVTVRSFNAAGFLAAVTDPLGRTTRYTTDTLGRVVSVTSPAGGTSTTVYDAAGNPLVAVDPLGRRTCSVYDPLNRPVVVRLPRPDAASATPEIRSTYDPVGRCIATTDPLGRTTWRQYDAVGRVTAVTDALGLRPGDLRHTIRTEYDRAGRATASTDELGRRTEYVYDTLGRRIRSLGPDAGQGRPTTCYGYDAADNLRYVTDPRGGNAGDPEFTTWTFYDGVGRVTAVVDPLGVDWPVTAIPEQLPESPVAGVTRSTYDARGRLTSITDASGRRTDYTVDNLGRRVSETGPAAAAGGSRPVTRHAYDAVGNRTGTIDALGRTMVSRYDSLDRLVATVDAAGLVTTTAYDLNGNRTSVGDAAGNETRFAYDRLGRLVRETDPLGNVTAFRYDLVGNRTGVVDRLGRGTSFIYDAADRLVEERWQPADGRAVTHAIRRFYDDADQLVGVTEFDATDVAATTAWQFDHDAAGNVVRSRMAPGELAQVPAFAGVPAPPGVLSVGDTTADWDEDGRPERYDGYTMALAAGEQLLLTVSSTAFDPVLIVQKPGGGPASAWLDDGAAGGTSARLRVVADVPGTWIFVVTAKDEAAAGDYDLRIVRDANVFVPDALVEHDFSYDKAGNLVATVEDQSGVADLAGLGKVVTGLGVRTTRTFDGLGRGTRLEQAVAGAAAKRADYVYNPDGSVATLSRTSGGSGLVGTTSNAYDGRGRLVGIMHAPAWGPKIEYGYAFDAADRIVSLTTPEGRSSFAFDPIDQLVSASLTGESYSYDSTGNRTGGGATTGAGNRLLSDGTYRYAYDAEGNRTARFRDMDADGALSAGDTDVTIYVWDQRNRLGTVSHVGTWTESLATAAVSRPAGGLPGSDLELRFTYDYADRRIRRGIDADGAAGPGREVVSYAGYAREARTLEIAQGTVMRDAAGTTTAFQGSVVQRTFQGCGVDEVLAVDRIAGAATETFWTLGDHQGSVRDIVSGSAGTCGRIVEHRQYDAFGRLVTRSSGATGAAAKAGVGVDFGYAGRPLEDRIGLSDNRARWYEPATGRFLSEDPTGFEGGDANLFRYVGNDPLDRVDPSGLMARWARGASFNAGRAPAPEFGPPRPAASAAAWASLGRPALTVSGITPRLESPAPAMPVLSIGTPRMTVARQQANAVSVQGPTVPRISQQDATLVTSGRSALQGVREPRWELDDREAALRADMAYQFKHGGMLVELGVGYDAKDPMNRFTSTGLSAMLTKSPTTGNYYLAFRGTESILDFDDLRTDAAQGVGFRASQYDMAIALTQRVQQKLGPNAKLILTGHSLGGGLAAAAAYATNSSATIFNPASINPTYAKGTPGLIRSHIVEGDFLSLGRTVLGRRAPGEIIVHPARTRFPLSQHGMANFPDY